MERAVVNYPKATTKASEKATNTTGLAMRIWRRAPSCPEQADIHAWNIKAETQWIWADGEMLAEM